MEPSTFKIVMRRSPDLTPDEIQHRLNRVFDIIFKAEAVSRDTLARRRETAGHHSDSFEPEKTSIANNS